MPRVWGFSNLPAPRISPGSRRRHLGRFLASVARAAASFSMQPTTSKPAASRPISSPPAPEKVDRAVGRACFLERSSEKSRLAPDYLLQNRFERLPDFALVLGSGRPAV